MAARLLQAALEARTLHKLFTVSSAGTAAASGEPAADNAISVLSHLGLQDHGGEIWFRRLRVKTLSAPDTLPLRTSANQDAAPTVANP